MSESEGSFGWETDEESANGKVDIKKEIPTSDEDLSDDTNDDISEVHSKRKSRIKKPLTDSDDSDSEGTSRNKNGSSNLETSPSKSSRSSSPKKSIRNNNNQVIKKEVNTDGDDDEEEVWGFQCPRDLDLSSLDKVDFFNHNNKMNVNGKTYEFKLKKYEDKRKLNIIYPDLPNNEKIKTYDFNGFIHVHDKIKPLNLIEILPEIKSIVKFPSNIKTRHPLLGAQYKTILKLSTDISEKLSDVKNCVRLKSKIKTEVDDMEEVEMEMPVSRKKKRKHEESLSENIISPKKIKLENPNDWLSEQSIEQSLFSTTPKIVKIKKEKK